VIFRIQPTTENIRPAAQPRNSRTLLGDYKETYQKDPRVIFVMIVILHILFFFSQVHKPFLGLVDA
jgi:hypothetical protein